MTNYVVNRGIMNKHNLDFSSLRQAIASLAQALEITVSDKFEQLDKSWQVTLIAGVIQNFEFSFELSWKMLKRQLEIELPSSAELDSMSYKTLIRTGYERGLLQSPEQWFDYRMMRNLASHTYNQDKAQQVYSQSKEFLRSASYLLERLEARQS
ncbi:hypothetical protein MNBD_GAMMA26-349 [hydrothermal vent metagenome]|uniref:Nucleotidyltransferase n=1 Tax=hydrothermal vent metagenome TaxID=652676 RepID=A0A3B1B5T2_9ZZZZ